MTLKEAEELMKKQEHFVGPLSLANKIEKIIESVRARFRVRPLVVRASNRGGEGQQRLLCLLSWLAAARFSRAIGCASRHDVRVPVCLLP